MDLAVRFIGKKHTFCQNRIKHRIKACFLSIISCIVKSIKKIRHWGHLAGAEVVWSTLNSWPTALEENIRDCIRPRFAFEVYTKKYLLSVKWLIVLGFVFMNQHPRFLDLGQGTVLFFLLSSHPLTRTGRLSSFLSLFIVKDFILTYLY